MAKQNNHATQKNENRSNIANQNPKNINAASEDQEPESGELHKDYDPPSSGPRTHGGGSQKPR